MDQDIARRAVIKVGDGRSFIIKVDGNQDHLVITAAHCLPFLSPCASTSYACERTYETLLDPLDGQPTFWAECRFADPVADIAVLGPPDSQELCDEWDAYVRFIEEREPMQICEAEKKCGALLLSLSKNWFECEVQHRSGSLWIANASSGIEGGMSGSPIVTEAGKAIGVLVCSGGGVDKSHTEGGPNPRLTHNLPGWCLQSLIP
jgi:hypothetical protein